MNIRLLVAALAASLLAAASFPTFANDATERDIGDLLESGELLSQEAIMRRAAEEHPGKVTEVELASKGGRYVYEIDVVDGNGKKMEFTFDARTGAVLSSRIDDDEDETDSDDD